MNIKAKYSDLNYYPLMLMALLLPFNMGVAIVLVVSLLLFFVLGNIQQGLKMMLKKKWPYVFLLFFFLHAGLYLLSEDKREALTSIEIKLGFLAFPLLVFTQRFNRIDIRKVFRTFAFGTFLCTVFNVARAFFYLLFFGRNEFLYYSGFSFFMHPSYYAMYAVFSILILSVLGLNYFNTGRRNLTAVVIMCLLLGIGVFMSASKMGILTLFVTLPVVLFYTLYKMKRIRLLIGVSAFIIAGSLIVLQLDFSPVQRLKNAFSFARSTETIDKTTAESNAVRVLVWNEAFTLIRQHPIIGVTPGDANNELYKAYERNGMTGALSKHLNAHNQYLQTALGTGMIGLLLLIVLTLGLMITGMIRKEILITLFGLIIVLNFLVESMLQTQAGTLFFVFFCPLLLAGPANVNKRY